VYAYLNTDKGMRKYVYFEDLAEVVLSLCKLCSSKIPEVSLQDFMNILVYKCPHIFDKADLSSPLIVQESCDSKTGPLALQLTTGLLLVWFEILKAARNSYNISVWMRDL
jgi:hypothetical protein